MALSSLSVNAQSKSDEGVLRKLPQTHCDAWNKRDAHELAMLMAEDVDFVTVATVYLHGRADYEKFHARLLAGRFKDSNFTPIETTVRFLRPDMAVVHWSWKITGDKNFDGTAREPRFGMMTMVAEKRSGTWLVVVAQNTNSLLGTPPELEGIKTLIPVPGPAHP
jgi:uncharacterized protein (TIGR02246 family)